MESLELELQYSFRNKELLSEAMNHSSYANEHRKGLGSNERLEFLGDSILGFVSAEYLFKGHPDLPEGDLTRMRASMKWQRSFVWANTCIWARGRRPGEAGSGSPFWRTLWRRYSRRSTWTAASTRRGV